MCKVWRQSILWYVERYSLLEVMRWSWVRKLLWRTTCHVVLKALMVRVHEVRQMWRVRMVCRKIDVRVWPLPMLSWLLRSMSIHVGRVSVLQLMRVGVLNRRASILLRAVRQLFLGHYRVSGFVVWNLCGNLVALR